MRFLVVYSWNFWFHRFLNLLSNNRSTCLRGITSAVQHVGGMCWGSVTDKLKMRRRQEKHIRWVHLSLTALDASISSERQVTHSTLYGSHVSRRKSRKCNLNTPSFCHLLFGRLCFPYWFWLVSWLWLDWFWLLCWLSRPHESAEYARRAVACSPWPRAGWPSVHAAICS